MVICGAGVTSGAWTAAAPALLAGRLDASGLRLQARSSFDGPIVRASSASASGSSAVMPSESMTP